MKMEPSYGEQINPVSRLSQILQAKKEAEPIFSFLRETGHARSKEFVMQVDVGGVVMEGSGPNKRLAKRNAAEEMLAKMGYLRPLPEPGKPAIKKSSCSAADTLSRSSHGDTIYSIDGTVSSGADDVSDAGATVDAGFADQDSKGAMVWLPATTCETSSKDADPSSVSEVRHAAWQQGESEDAANEATSAPGVNGAIDEECQHEHRKERRVSFRLDDLKAETQRCRCI